MHCPRKPDSELSAWQVLGWDSIRFRKRPTFLLVSFDCQLEGDSKLLDRFRVRVSEGRNTGELGAHSNKATVLLVGKDVNTVPISLLHGLLSDLRSPQ